jgi:hypothetical protein
MTIYVSELILMFIEEGIVFFAMFDPTDGCHHTKKASFHHEFECQCSITDCISMKMKILDEGNVKMT